MGRKAKSEDAGHRYVPPGSCTWCGHLPHPTECGQAIRLSKSKSGPCPCARRAL